jgi:hypothetical protein
MKSYKDFEKTYIGASDMASLTIRSCKKVSAIDYAEDGAYMAYECYGDEVEIGSHYKLVFSGDFWLTIYDDIGRAYNEHQPNGFKKVDVYRAGEYGTIIHWHN